MEECNNHDENESKNKLELKWEDYLSMSAAELLRWKNYMSISEAELEWKKYTSMSLQEILEWKKFIPIGYRFAPTDYQLLKYYLLPKVREGFVLPGVVVDIIRESDVYQYHPAYLPGLDKGEELCYFFTTRDQKHENSKRAARTTKDKRGHWRMTSKITRLFDGDSELGRKNSLVYHLTKPPDGPSNKDLKTNWIMHEYVLHKSLYDPSQVPSTSSNKPKQLLLCRIYERKKVAAKEEKSQTESNRSSQIKEMTTENGKSICNNHKSDPKIPSVEACNIDAEPSSYYCEVDELPSRNPKRSRPSPIEDDITDRDDSMSFNDSTSSSFEASQVSQKTENGQLLEDINKEESQNIGHMKEENDQSGHLLANVREDQNSTEIGRIEGSPDPADTMSEDCLSTTLTSQPATQR